jgi:glycosyltransferase involved in cell wall biosynthesis
MATVSIITPIYNGEKYLENYVENILKMTYKEVEFVFIDNNSTDNSVSKLNTLLEPTNLHYIILTETQQGAGYARNTGIKIAKGEYLVFLDCDDTIDPQKIEYDLKIIHQNDVDFVFCRAIRTYEDGRQLKHPINGIKEGINNPPDLGLVWLTSYFHLQGTGSMFVKKQVVLDLGGFHITKSGEDAFLFIRLGLLYKGYFYDKAWFNYIRYSESTVSMINKNKHGRLMSYFTLRKQLYVDPVILGNPLSKKIVTRQLQSDILKLNKAGYKIKDLLNDEKLKDFKLDFIVFNKLSLFINKFVSKNYHNPFVWIWLKIKK